MCTCCIWHLHRFELNGSCQCPYEGLAVGFKIQQCSFCGEGVFWAACVLQLSSNGGVGRHCGFILRWHSASACLSDSCSVWQSLLSNPLRSVVHVIRRTFAIRRTVTFRMDQHLHGISSTAVPTPQRDNPGTLAEAYWACQAANSETDSSSCFRIIFSTVDLDLSQW